MVAHIQHFRGTGEEEHPKLQASQSYQGSGKKKKGPAGKNPEMWLLSLVLHPTSLDLKCPLGLLEESSLWRTLRHWAAALLPSGPESRVSTSRCAASVETPPGSPLQLCTAAYRVASQGGEVWSLNLVERLQLKLRGYLPQEVKKGEGHPYPLELLKNTACPGLHACKVHSLAQLRPSTADLSPYSSSVF